MTQAPVYLEELPYSPDSCALFERIRDLPHALLLDSSFPHSRAGRFDILTADPEQSLPFSSDFSNTHDGVLKYFEELSLVHSSLFGGVSAPAEDIPFCGGVAGYLDYELGHPLQRLPLERRSHARLHAYGWSVIQDHLRQRCTFTALPWLDLAKRRRLLERLRQPRKADPSTFRLRDAFTCNMEAASYREAFQKVQAYILSGDCYQVNLARRFSAPCEGDAWSAYLALRQLAAAPFAGFMECADDEQLLCLSPERFLSLNGHRVETRPIKGTRPRQRDARSDELMAQELRQSSKDRAENLMIVDLLRNDIGRSCVAGSIHVDRLFELESYPTVHHLVSTISGELLPERTAYELLRDCYPGGSITGAPKRRAMEIISELEPHPRQAYCGSLIYISADGRMDSNISIRSLLRQGEKIHCWAGGGVVADSECDLEFQESWDKVGRFLHALEESLRSTA